MGHRSFMIEVSSQEAANAIKKVAKENGSTIVGYANLGSHIHILYDTDGTLALYDVPQSYSAR